MIESHSITYIKIRRKKECRNEDHKCKVWVILGPKKRGHFGVKIVSKNVQNDVSSQFFLDYRIFYVILILIEIKGKENDYF